MAGSNGHHETSRRSVACCTECNARLAHDQRYCLACGARRGPLRGWIAQQIVAIREQGRPVTVPGAAAEPPPHKPRSMLWGIRMPDPRLAAVAVMGILSFGVIVGSIASPTIAGMATAPLIVVERAAGITGGGASGSGLASDNGGGGGGGGGTETITVTTTAPTPPIPSGSFATTAPTTSSSSSTTQTTGFGGLPPIKHVFLIVLSSHGFNDTFSTASKDTYLNTTLVKQGKLVQSYYSVAQSPLANEVALISGQGPNPQTLAGCPQFTPLTPTGKGPMGQVLGSGCVYPAKTQTIADQLSAKHETWRAYVQNMNPPTQPAPVKPATCRRPPLGAVDPNQMPSAKDPYVTSTNPFVYFASLITGKHAQCAKEDVDFDKLARDLKSSVTTPTFSYIVPDACDNGSEQPCAPGAAAGLPAADAFLKKLIPQIKTSPAYKDSGLIAITFDQAPQSGPGADSSACCDQPTYPNLTPSSTTTPTTTTTTSTTATTTSTTDTTTSTTSTPPPYVPPAAGGFQTSATGGGGHVGLLLISPYVKPGTTDEVDFFNHFALLASFEKLLGLKRIGYASDLQLPSFDTSIFDRRSY